MTANQTVYLQCPHVAKQLPSGRWSSKNNEFEIFEHSPESLESEGDTSPPKPTPDECKEPLGGGAALVHRPLNFGRMALVMSRDMV
jgi:hypothetical protein